MTIYFTTDTVANAVTTDDSETDADDFTLDEASIVTVDNPPWERAFDTNKFYKFDVVVARPIEQQYIHDGEIKTFKKTAEALKDATWSLDNKPYPLTHPDTKIVTDQSEVHGFHRQPRWSNDADGVVTSLYVPVTDDMAKEFLKRHQDVSVGFHNSLQWETDEPSVDAYQVDMYFDHVAGVDQGRCSDEDGCGIVVDTTMEQLDAIRTPVIESKHGSNSSSSTDAFSVGQTVAWSFSGGTAHGRIDSVERDGTLSAEGTTREGTSERPAYKIEVYREDDEEYRGFAVKLHGENNLRSWAGPTADSCSGDTCSCGCHEDVGTVEETPTTDSTMTEDNDGDNGGIDFESLVSGMNVDAIAEHNEYVAKLTEDKEAAEEQVEVLEGKIEELEATNDALETKLDEFENGERQPKTAIVDDILDLTEAWDEDELMDLDHDVLQRRKETAMDVAQSASTPSDEGGNGGTDETPTTDSTPSDDDDSGRTVSDEHRSWA